MFLCKELYFHISGNIISTCTIVSISQINVFRIPDNILCIFRKSILFKSAMEMHFVYIPDFILNIFRIPFRIYSGYHSVYIFQWFCIYPGCHFCLKLPWKYICYIPDTILFIFRMPFLIHPGCYFLVYIPDVAFVKKHYEKSFCLYIGCHFIYIPNAILFVFRIQFCVYAGCNFVYIPVIVLIKKAMGIYSIFIPDVILYIFRIIFCIHSGNHFVYILVAIFLCSGCRFSLRKKYCENAFWLYAGSILFIFRMPFCIYSGTHFVHHLHTILFIFRISFLFKI